MLAASMPLDKPPSPSAVRPQPDILKILLLIITVLQTLGAFSKLPIAMFALMDKEPLSFGNWFGAAVIALGPFLAVPALVFTIKGRFQHAIMAIAALGLLDWLSYVPPFVSKGLEFSATAASLFSAFYLFVLPASCIAAIVLAVRNRRLILATVLSSMQMLVTALGAIAMAIGVAIYGF